MKLLGRNRTPEQRLREAVEASDSGLEMRVSALLRPYGYMSPTPASLERVEKALESVGLIAEPSIRGRSWDEHVVVRRTSAGETPTATRERVVPPPPPPNPADVVPLEQSIDEAVTLAQATVTNGHGAEAPPEAEATGGGAAPGGRGRGAPRA